MTTSIEMTKAEIERFLRGSEPGVLCVTGEYGVGKTFLWRSVLDDLRKSRGLSLGRYSYVSLFGLNSLDDIKSSLFENMEWLDQEPINFAQRGKAGAKALAARAKKLSELAGALPWVGQAFTKARSLYFSLIQNQIVCIDDLDRKSENLNLKDALGLISFLREQRQCKVALLLNAEKLALMKYVDTMILDADEIQGEARALQEQQRVAELHGTFEAAWRGFHDSFDDDEDKVVQEMVDGTKKSHEIVSLPNLNEVVLVLKRLGREAEAKHVIKFFAEKRNDAGYWNPEDDPFERGPFDPDITAVMEQKKPTEPTEFDVAAALLRAGKDYDSEAIAKLATVPAQTYYDIISAERGDRLRSLVLSAFEFRRISNASNDMRRVVSLMEEALQMVGRKSLLNELRVKKYGVSIDREQEEETREQAEEDSSTPGRAGAPCNPTRGASDS